MRAIAPPPAVPSPSPAEIDRHTTALAAYDAEQARDYREMLAAIRRDDLAGERQMRERCPACRRLLPA